MRCLPIVWCCAGLLVATAPVTVRAAEKRLDQAKPVQDIDPRNRAIPELTCISQAGLIIAHDSLTTSASEAVLHMRLRGNVLYMGRTASEQTVWGTLSRTDRRRWASGTSVFVLDEELKSGSWVKTEFGTTTIHTLRCTQAGR